MGSYARAGCALAAAAVAALAMAAAASPHAGLLETDPPVGSALGASPTVVRLTFSEQPQASFSSIRIVDSKGGRHELGRPQLADDRLTLSEGVRPLPRGVYTVRWRVVSAVDGHASSGAFVFGVRQTPTGPVVVAGAAPSASWFELVARWILLGGLVVLVGASAAAVGRYGGDDLRLAAAGWGVAVLGLLLLAEAQRRTAGTSFHDLLATPVGHALIRRAAGLAVAGIALLAASRLRGARYRLAMLAAGLGGLFTIVEHVAAGHAAAVDRPHWVTIAAQSAHVGGVAVWLGGLAALMLGTRHAGPGTKAAALRRFSTVALLGLLVVVGTGVLRAVDELTSVSQLVSTGYGRGISLKIVLLLGIVALALANRRRGAPVSGASFELGLAVVAIGAAALIGTFAPPAVGRLVPQLGLSVSGSDPGATTSAELTAASADPGPNRFLVKVTGYHSKKRVPPSRVRLLFTPLDDPGVRTTSLLLGRTPDGSYAGSGPNLAFDGRWGVRVVVERDGDAVEIPLELETRTPPEPVSIAYSGTLYPTYSVEVGREGSLGFVRFAPRPSRPGPSKMVITVYSLFQNDATVKSIVFTMRHEDGPTQQVPLRRTSPSRYVADVVLRRGTTTVAVVTRIEEAKSRLHAVTQIEVR